jgi:cytochrome c biogenesis protein CcmG, thiol:disulfide interchange protein DsbE
MRRAIFILPVLAFAILAFFLFRSLWGRPPDILPSVLIDKPAPTLGLAALEGSPGFTDADLRSGHVSIVNFFASWCAPCRLEADTLSTLSKKPGVTLYGVAYHDRPDDTRQFLSETGDPFSAIVADVKGLRAIDWGVTAAPETFVVDGNGVIRFKYVGQLTDQVIAQQLMPAVQVAAQAR